MTHPFERWPATGRRALTLVAIGGTLGATAAVLVADGPLRDSGESTFEFETAGSAERAQEIVGTWRSEGVMEEAGFILGFDFLYPLLYGAALAALCVWAAARWRSIGGAGIAAAGTAFAWIAFGAAASDYVENVGLAVSLFGEPTSPWPELSLAMAVLKFAGIAASALYAGNGGLAALLARRAALRRVP